MAIVFCSCFKFGHFRLQFCHLADVAFVLQQEEVLAYIKIDSLQRKSASEILTALQDVDPNCSFGFSTVADRCRNSNLEDPNFHPSTILAGLD